MTISPQGETELGLRLDQMTALRIEPRRAVGFGPLSRLPLLATAHDSGLQMPRSRYVSALSLAAVLVPLPYGAPATTRYRIDQALTQEIDGTTAGGGKQTLSFTTSTFITMSLADSGGGKVMRVMVDSMRGDSATPIPAAVLDSARGAVFRGFIEKSGKMSGLAAPSGNSAAAQVQGLLSEFFPWIKTGAKVGDSWTDTTATVNGVGADSVTVRRVSAYKATGTQVWNSKKAIRITEDFTSSVSGTQPTPSGPAKLEGTGKGTAAYYVTSDGRYLGGEWQQQSLIKVSGSFAQEPVPINIAQTTRITALK
jgi:hypothetical protein